MLHRLCLLLAAALALAGCAASPVSSAAVADAPDPTEFVATRVSQLLTESAPPAPGAFLSPPAERMGDGERGAATQPPAALPTAGATITPPPSPETPAAPPTPATPCADQACAAAAEHFWLGRPIPGAYNVSPDRTYPFGSTQQGQREPHHGVEFQNPSGTPVTAAAPGTVIVAGDDAVTAYGPATRFYGNVVVVELDQRLDGQPVYNLYAHLSGVTVAAGQAVQTGDMLGTVGQTGVAIGPHLHFEVRVGNNEYGAARNPELWLQPLLYNGRPWGALAGRVLDPQGNPLTEVTVVVRPESVDYDAPRTRYAITYASPETRGDDRLQENFALTDLPLGTYIVSVNTTTLYRQTVTVEAGRLTWVTFTVNPPPPATAIP